MSKDWKSPVYAFYELLVGIKYVGRCQCHVFKCVAVSCQYTACRFLDTKDKSSTGNLIKHIKTCWGNKVWAAASECQDASEAQNAIVKPFTKSGSITASFERKGKGAVTYSHHQHMKTRQSRDAYLILQALLIFNRAKIVCWVSESNCPFKIVEDWGFLNLMKTGQSHYYIPSATTVSQDVKLVFGRTHEKIAKILKVLLVCCKERLTIYQEYDGLINLITNCWTLPNHIAYMALISQFEVKGLPITIVLDVVELPKASLDVSSQQMCTERLELVTLGPEHGTGIQGDSRRIRYWT